MVQMITDFGQKMIMSMRYRSFGDWKIRASKLDEGFRVFVPVLTHRY